MTLDPSCWHRVRASGTAGDRHHAAGLHGRLEIALGRLLGDPELLHNVTDDVGCRRRPALLHEVREGRTAPRTLLDRGGVLLGRSLVVERDWPVVLAPVLQPDYAVLSLFALPRLLKPERHRVLVRLWVALH